MSAASIGVAVRLPSCVNSIFIETPAAFAARRMRVTSV